MIDDPSEGGAGEEWFEVLVTYDSLEAEMVKDILESGGIAVVIRSSKVSPYPVNVGKIGEVRVLVREDDREIAERVLRGVRDGELSISGDGEEGDAGGDQGGFRRS